MTWLDLLLEYTLFSCCCLIHWTKPYIFGTCRRRNGKLTRRVSQSRRSSQIGRQAIPGVLSTGKKICRPPSPAIRQSWWERWGTWPADLDLAMQDPGNFCRATENKAWQVVLYNMCNARLPNTNSYKAFSLLSDNHARAAMMKCLSISSQVFQDLSSSEGLVQPSDLMSCINLSSICHRASLFHQNRGL